ncbi:GH-E family nuclease [Leptospira cinconiae]|uniref:GH-E family nuclease n=1 Tax=Leptospira cinconiae TaxID=3235173 RepID=UPI00399CBB57
MILGISTGSLLFFASCQGGANFLSRMFPNAAPSGFGFLSPGSAPAPEGSDLFSISTNYSGEVDDPEGKADPLDSAVFIPPPEPNSFGTISLSYDLDIPEGRAGMEPDLSISYSSTGGDGWVGVGWDIGLGGITRTPEFGALFYDNRDSFLWNGQRLVKVSGSSSNENGTYRPEITGGDSPILKLSNIENGGVWEVLEPSGKKNVYGDSASSRIYDPAKITRTYAWYLSKSEDLNGNYMQVSYDTSGYSENRSLFLKEIRYTGNSKTGHNPKQYVRFHTKAREDAYVSMVSGFFMKMDRMLDTIEIGWDGGKLWEYEMVYDVSPDSGRPILKTVESNRHTTKPEFQYQTSDRYLVWKNFANQAVNEPEITPNSTEYFEGDFNGDGLSDIVFFNPENGNWKAAEGRKEGGYNFKLYGNRYKGYKGEEKIRFFKGNVSGDFNGDGRADLAFYLPETRDFIVAEHDGRIFQFKNYGRMLNSAPDIFRMEWFSGDYDGNGLSDSVLFDEPTGQWTLMLNKGGRFEFLKFAKKFQNVYRGDYSPNSNWDSVSTTDTSEEGKGKYNVNFLVGDYNGDGRTDISLYDARSGKWYVGENHRNEDKTDPLLFKMQWRLYKTFSAPEQALFGNDRFSGDFNGDGFSDFLLLDRSKGDWIIGETGNGTINFRTWSKVPQFKEITRWLQGDFNGDGRTDIGFYSATDGKFWIGEATNSGFRYKAYSDMQYGPSQERVMKTPLPKDEVSLKEGSASFFASSDSKTVSLDYTYDGNINPGKGELVYPGCFTVNDCSASPELLIYDRKANTFDLKKGSAFTNSVLSGLNPEDPAFQSLYGGKAGRFTRSDRDEILFYRNEGSSGKRLFSVRHTSGNAFEIQNFSVFADSDLANFSAYESGYVVDNFESPSYKSLLAIDDQALDGTDRFVLISGQGPSSTKKILTLAEGSDPTISENLLGIFRSGDFVNRQNRKNFSLFSGNFTGPAGTTPQLLLLDRRLSTHKWYLGTLQSGNKILIKKLSGDVSFPLTAAEFNTSNPAGISYGLYPEGTGGKSVIIGKSTDNGTSFYKFTITSSSIARSIQSTSIANFTGSFDHLGNPIVKSEGQTKIFDFSQGKLIVPPAYLVSVSLDRPDLIEQVYVFQWLQGDYNGDGLTDIGFINLKEPTWYFAMSTGSVPDVIEKVKNGIGGIYEFEYENSTKFDNTGGDEIPDLPANLRACTKITLDDGFGNRIPKIYEYSGGVAFSAFINGKLESDSFGFTNFIEKDAYGSRTIETHYSQPFANFMDNRALGGAVKETHVIGSDNQEYGSVFNTYEIKHIETVPSIITYFPLNTKTQKYKKGVLVETSTDSVVLDGYKVVKKTETETDHFRDSAHASDTVTEITEYETVDSTNQTREKKNITFAGTDAELTETSTYDSRGNSIRSVTSYTGSGLPAVAPQIEEYEYDSYGNQTEKKDVSSSPARGTTYTYDNQLHQLVTETVDFGGSTGFSTKTTYDFGAAFGEPLEVRDQNGNKVYYQYDSYGRTVQTSADTDNGISVSSINTYDSGFPLGGKTVLPSGSGDPDFATKTYIDGLGRPLHNVKTGSEGKYIRSGKMTYDAAGRLVRVGQADWTNGGDMDRFVLHLEEKNPTIFEFDPIGRIKKSTFPIAAGETQATYTTVTYNDPYETVEYHSGGTSKRTIHNGGDDILYVEDFGADGTQAKVGFCYDTAGNMVKKADLNNGSPLNCSDLSSGIAAKDTSGKNQLYRLYDAFGNLKVQSDPDLGVDTFVYNAFGDITRQTDARGLITTFEYDSLGRVIARHYPDEDVYFTYDSYSGSENSLGKLVFVEDSNQTKKFSYDKLGRTKKEVRTLKNIPLEGVNGPYVTEYKYDLLDRLISIDYPEHPVNHTRLKACYTYGSEGYINGLSVQVNTNGVIPGFCNKTIVENITYNENGQTASFRLGNGTQTNYEYDVKARLTKIQSSAEVDGTTKTLQNAVYSFNSKNSIERIENTTSDFSTLYNYNYDGISRLISATGTYTETSDPSPRKFHQTYSYAKNGNLTAKRKHNPADGNLIDEQAYQYVNHQVVQIDSSQNGNESQIMTYDPAGNMITQRNNTRDLTKNLEYDAENRIKRITDHNGAILGRYWYDEGGFRIRKSALIPSGAVSRNSELYYPNKFYGLEYSEENNILASINNVYLNGVRIAAIAENGATLYYLNDQVDSVSHVLDEEAHTLTRNEYQPYGETFVQVGNTDLAPKYNSQELDRESEFYFYNARYYDPALARFLTADTIIAGENDTQAWNRFSYVRGNPILYKDPTGHIVAHLIAGAAGAVVNVAFQAGTDLVTGQVSPKEKYLATAGGGFAQGVATATCGPTCGMAVGAAVEDALHQGLTKGFSNIDYKQSAGEGLQGALGGKAAKIVGKAGKKLAGAAFEKLSKSGIGKKVKDGVSKFSKKASKIKEKVKGSIKKATKSVKNKRTSSIGKIKKSNKQFGYRRPYIRKAVRKEVERRAKKNSKGQFIDPNTRKPISGKYDLGHKKGHEFKREAEKARKEGLTQKEFNDKMNNSKYYQIEDPSSNRSHKFELK